MKFLRIFPISILGKILNNISDLDIVNYKDFLLKETYSHENKNGELTINQRILEHSIFKKLKNNILESSREYLIDQGHEFEDIQIISSWGNRINNQENIHPHHHANSYLSGVFYFDNSSSISFVNPSQPLWHFKSICKENGIEPKNLYSCTPIPKLLLIFPSFLSHFVSPNQSFKPRLSIAFNIIPKGEFGPPTAKLYL